MWRELVTMGSSILGQQPRKMTQSPPPRPPLPLETAGTPSKGKGLEFRLLSLESFSWVKDGNRNGEWSLYLVEIYRTFGLELKEKEHT